jgi:hypothetical protein
MDTFGSSVANHQNPEHLNCPSIFEWRLSCCCSYNESLPRNRKKEPLIHTSGDGCWVHCAEGGKPVSKSSKLWSLTFLKRWIGDGEEQNGTQETRSAGSGDYNGIAQGMKWDEIFILHPGHPCACTIYTDVKISLGMLHTQKDWCCCMSIWKYTVE